MKGRGEGLSEKEETFCTLTDTQVLIPIVLTKNIKEAVFSRTPYAKFSPSQTVSGWSEFSIMDANDGNNSIGKKTIN